LLEEGISEAGALGSFIAAGTAYATHGLPMVPFFMFYSMFGFQRVGDLIWAAGDMRCRGFLVGGTAGRTTLAGEGLQHQDGHSHLLAHPYPTVLAYDPAFAFELAVIIEEGLRQMLEERRDVIYYLTVGNEPHPMPLLPEGVREGILRGLYRFRRSSLGEAEAHAHLVASGMLVHEALRAQEILESRHGVAAHVWSATSWKRLFEDGIETERWNRLHPRERRRIPYVAEALATDPGVVVAVSDYTQALPASLGRWIPAETVTLGTQGFGRSDSRKALRDHFEVSAEHIAFSALAALAAGRGFRPEMLEQARQDLGIDPERPPPWRR
jgi:pyruvate dehydrogenase E1 component